MPRDLLPPGTGANVTGQWVRTEPPAHKTWPMRVMFVGPNWTAGSVILEELADGLPKSKGPLPGNPGDLVASSQTGTVVPLYTAIAGSNDYEIDAPTEFIRARTDADVVGTVTVRLIEAE